MHNNLKIFSIQNKFVILLTIIKIKKMGVTGLEPVTPCL